MPVCSDACVYVQTEVRRSGEGMIRCVLLLSTCSCEAETGSAPQPGGPVLFCFVLLG